MPGHKQSQNVRTKICSERGWSFAKEGHSLSLLASLRWCNWLAGFFYQTDMPLPLLCLPLFDVEILSGVTVRYLLLVWACVMPSWEFREAYTHAGYTEILKELGWVTELILYSHLANTPCCTDSALGGLKWECGKERQRSIWGVENLSCSAR